jgi:predicted DNA-binding WGR domain protein
LAVRHSAFVEGNSSKFWGISVDGCTTTLRFGRIGTASQTKVKTFADAAAAQRNAAELVEEQAGKGYVEKVTA